MVGRAARAGAAMGRHVDEPFARVHPDPVEREQRAQRRERTRCGRAPEMRDERAQRAAADEPFVDVAEQDHGQRARVERGEQPRDLRAALGRRQPEMRRDDAQHAEPAFDVRVERAARLAVTERQIEHARRADRKARQHRVAVAARGSIDRRPFCRMHAGARAQVREHVG